MRKRMIKGEVREDRGKRKGRTSNGEEEHEWGRRRGQGKVKR